jgi:hypothetical protein
MSVDALRPDGAQDRARRAVLDWDAPADDRRVGVPGARRDHQVLGGGPAGKP